MSPRHGRAHRPPADDILSLFGHGRRYTGYQYPGLANAAADEDLELDLVPFSLDEITGVVRAQP